MLNLAEIQEAATKNLAKAGGFLLVIFFAIQARDSEGLIKLAIREYSVDFQATTIGLFGAVSLFFFAFQIQNWISLLLLRTRISTRIRHPGFNANCVLFLQGKDEMNLAVPILPFSFLKERFLVAQFLSLLLITSLAALLLPIAAVWQDLFALGIERFSDQSVDIWEKTISVLLVLICSASPIYLILMNVPIPMKKNVEAIRWGFLYPYGIYPHHPMLGEWIDKNPE